MNKTNIYEVLQPDRFKTWLKTAFTDAGITTTELLKDDRKIERAALMAYEKIPLFPFRKIIKTTIGKNGFTKLVFSIHDKMLEFKSIDLSWLNFDFLRSILSKYTKI